MSAVFLLFLATEDETDCRGSRTSVAVLDWPVQKQASLSANGTIFFFFFCKSLALCHLIYFAIL